MKYIVTARVADQPDAVQLTVESWNIVAAIEEARGQLHSKHPMQPIRVITVSEVSK